MILHNTLAAERKGINLENIRVGNKVEVGVNDAGDSIVLNFDDCMFIDNFFYVAESLERASDFFNGEFENLGEREQVKATKEKMLEITKEIDNLFGENSCKKIFGDIVPSPYLVYDLFDQLLPIIQRYTDERQKKIAEKYNNKRKGSRTEDN